MLRGDALLHTDYNPPNVLIAEADTYLIDWAWPTRGAAWIDPACLVVRLIDAGNTPAQAESWAGQTLAWSEAPTEALDMFSRASWRTWDQIASHDAAEWKSSVAASAKAWMDHRAAKSQV